MCGIVGFWSSNGMAEPLDVTVGEMNCTLTHRGPDATGKWADADAGIALAHSRLSILDLSPEGNQPMLSRTGRYVIAYNGEIYNYREIRQELESASGVLPWRGHSDTEVLLEAVERWGVEKAVERCNGMFAFALWDRSTRRLHLGRDRLGEKPLYYGWRGNTFLFASELKAMRKHPRWFGEIDRGALTLYMRHNCVPGRYSIYEGIFKLRPGELLSLDCANGKGEPQIHAYWSAADAYARGEQAPFRGDENEAADRLEELLRDSIALRMQADVPVGAFLSGGIDSSAIVALMQQISPGAVRTFSIGNTEAAYDEAHHARQVAEHLGTEHTELYVTAEEALAVIPRLPTIYDEPFADSSQIPTTLLAALTREHVTVSLSGDGGDELFGGYNRYVWGTNIWRAIGWMPPPLRAAAARAIRAVRPEHWDEVISTVQRIVPAERRVRRGGDQAHKFAEILDVRNPAALYGRLVTHWSPDDLVIGGSEPPTELSSAALGDSPRRFVRQMMYLDLVGYLPDDILVKVDRASMAASLEARVPLLDHRIVEFAATLPPSLQIRGSRGKLVLRKVLYRHVPRALVERPKMGFGVPLDSWLRGPLRAWAESLLEPGKLRRQGFLHEAEVTNKWKEHISGAVNRSYLLWDVLMFQAWAEENGAV